MLNQSSGLTFGYFQWQACDYSSVIVPKNIVEGMSLSFQGLVDLTLCSWTILSLKVEIQFQQMAFEKFIIEQQF